MALRLEAGDLARDAARYGALELIESQDSNDTAASDGVGDCPSADDLLDFCQGTLSVQGSIFVQRHLDQCAVCMDLTTLALNDWAPHVPSEWHDVATNFHPGDRVDDRYEIVRFLACGGMGEVYEAIDTRTSERVALKAILAASSDNRHLLRSFRQEARLARKVRHAHVCRAHDPDPTRDVIPRPLVPYFTMELVDGEPLNERLRRRPLALDQALDIARQLLLGIGAVHRAGLLHLDLKSSNVMLRRDADQVVIVDFGLARRISEDHGPERMRPLTGSLAYMPPEQILGKTPGVQNDIFAFGVVLFQMLTGDLPFPAAQPSTATSIAERLTARAPSPSALATAVPAWLDELVRRCLAEPDERFRDVDEVLEALTLAGR